ncbi:MAG: Hint domain-containing protein [Pseudomonadota bacterium]
MKPNTVGGIGGQSPSQAYTYATGFAADAIIMTLDGEKRMDEVREGDRIITRDSGMAVLTSVSSRVSRTLAVRIKAGSLGHTRPDRDVTLPAGQPILIRDWRAQAMFGAERAMVPAAKLEDGEFITLVEDEEMTLFTLEFDSPHVLYVDGLEVASDANVAAVSKAA